MLCNHARLQYVTTESLHMCTEYSKHAVLRVVGVVFRPPRPFPNLMVCFLPQVTQRLLQMGCYSVSLGDTVGAGTAGSTAALLDAIRAAGVSMSNVAVHFHDTYGQALTNILVALEEVRVFGFAWLEQLFCPARRPSEPFIRVTRIYKVSW